MDKVIYKDDYSTITTSQSWLTIQAARTICLRLKGLDIRDLSAADAARLRGKGRNPADYYMLYAGGQPQAILPAASRQAVSQAISQAAQDNRPKAEDPAVIARRKVDDLFAEAEAMIDDPGQYYALRAEAKQAYRDWAAAYPDAARKEEADKLLAQVRRLEEMAANALVYDCDGDLDAAARQARADGYTAEAADLRAKAEALLANS